MRTERREVSTRRFGSFACAALAIACLAAVSAGPSHAQLSEERRQAPQQDQSAGPEGRPYDAQLFRLAEIVGAVHYLRELCGAEEGQVWREQMRALVASEGTSALRRAKLVESFNKGYRGYSRTYRTCTRSALVAIDRFMEQGAAISDTLVENDR